MIYKEYKATESRVLLNIDNFEFCNGAICKIDANIDYVEVSLEEAQYYNEKYQEELRKQQEQEFMEASEVMEEKQEEKPVLIKGTKSLKTTSVEEPADPVQRLKNLLKEEMVFKGYNLNNLVKPIIHD